MSLPTFPTIALPNSWEEDSEDIGQRSKMQDGSTVGRPIFTKSRRVWMMGWNALSNADYQALFSFWQTYGSGSNFNYTTPQGVAVVGYIAKKDPFREIVGTGKWQGSIVIGEP